MDIDVARGYLRLADDVDAWDPEDWSWIRRTSMSVDWGLGAASIVAEWNRLVPSELAVTARRESTEDAPGFTDRLASGNSSVTVPYVRSPDYCMRVTLALNGLVGDRAELRLVRASTGNSDWCYLPLRPADWDMLEAEGGRDLVEARFQRLPDTWEALEAALDEYERRPR
jgi:hypothetical protein